MLDQRFVRQVSHDDPHGIEGLPLKALSLGHIPYTAPFGWFKNLQIQLEAGSFCAILGLKHATEEGWKGDDQSNRSSV